MNKVTIKGMASSEKTTWQTPQDLVELVRRFGNGEIALDPATADENPTGALNRFTPKDDGLAQDWPSFAGDGIVYCNPPYGRALPAWIEKVLASAALGLEIIVLLPARTDTRWWQDAVVKADAVLYLRGRLTFKGATQGAMFPSALLYFGDSRKRFIRFFGHLGVIS